MRDVALRTRLRLMVALATLSAACESPRVTPQGSAGSAAASAPAPLARSAEVSTGTSVALDTPRGFPSRAERNKLRRVGTQVVIDSAKKWNRSCAIHTKCKLQAVTLPHCPADSAAEQWSIPYAAKAEHFTDPHVAIRGHLLPTSGFFSSAVACGVGRCCNGTRVDIVLEGPPSDLELTGFGCAGDESRLCCNVMADGQEVIATGELRYSSGSWWLDKVSLCSVAD
jgi:hypothetical protein